MPGFQGYSASMQTESQAKVALLRTWKRLPIPLQSAYPAQPGGNLSNSSVLIQVVTRLGLTAL